MKACLIIIFNHRFEANLPTLRSLYKNRFDHVRYLMPFYRGTDPDVIPVIESSARFQGYVAQGLPRFYDDGFTHYVFAADDLLINPALDQTSLLSKLGLGEEDGHIKELISVSDDTFDWPFLYMTLKMCRFTNFVNAREELPSREEAMHRFGLRGLSTRPLGWRNLPRLERRRFLWSLRVWTACFALLYGSGEVRKVVYPLARAYSDLFVVPKAAIKHFCHLCGVFAAMGVFVECAIPTALVLSIDRIRLEKDLPCKGIELLHDWNRREFEEQHEKKNWDVCGRRFLRMLCTSIRSSFPVGRRTRDGLDRFNKISSRCVSTD